MASQSETEKVEKFPEQKGFKAMQIVQFECSRHLRPSFILLERPQHRHLIAALKTCPLRNARLE